MAKTKEVQVVETKAAKVDKKVLAESIEKAFKDNKVVDVIADTNLENPTALSYEEYRFIHFYRKGTQKDLFQLYITGKTGEFFVRKQAAEFLGEEVEKKPATKKIKGEVKVIHIIVKAPIETVPEVAEKILTACVENDKAVEKARVEKAEAKKKEKAEKKAEAKEKPKKATKAKKTEAKEEAEKKAANK